jgi:hypothetical protein
MCPCASDSEAAAQEFCFEALLTPPWQYGATNCRRAASASIAEFAFLSSERIETPGNISQCRHHVSENERIKTIQPSVLTENASDALPVGFVPSI